MVLVVTLNQSGQGICFGVVLILKSIPRWQLTYVFVPYGLKAGLFDERVGHIHFQLVKAAQSCLLRSWNVWVHF